MATKKMTNEEKRADIDTLRAMLHKVCQSFVDDGATILRHPDPAILWKASTELQRADGMQFYVAVDYDSRRFTCGLLDVTVDGTRHGERITHHKGPPAPDRPHVTADKHPERIAAELRRRYLDEPATLAHYTALCEQAAEYRTYYASCDAAAALIAGALPGERLRTEHKGRAFIGCFCTGAMVEADISGASVTLKFGELNAQQAVALIEAAETIRGNK